MFLFLFLSIILLLHERIHNYGNVFFCIDHLFAKMANIVSVSHAFISFYHFVLNSASSPTTKLSYDDHWSSIVLGSTTNEVPLAKFPIARTHHGYCTGDDKLLNQNSTYHTTIPNSILLRTGVVHESDIKGLFKVEVTLIFINANTYVDRHRSSSTSFTLHGFWSELKGNLCVTGSGYSYSNEGHSLNFDAILKLHNLTNSTSITSLISGTFESLSSVNEPGFLETISMLLLLKQITSTYVLEESKNVCFGGSDDIPQGLSLGSLPTKISVQ